jgi:hypothetical protein
MQKLIIGLALLLVAGAPEAMAQGRNSNSSNNAGGVPPAPIGHRQPRADQVPNEKNLSNPNEPVNKEDALLDKKIKSICRGC